MIGIYDSGSGGLTVLRELRQRAPEADIVYFGDLKNAPYGNKSREELGALTVLGIQKLIDEGATQIISACNSVSVSIVLPMFEILELPHANIIEMVGPTVSSFKSTPACPLVLATRATVESAVYQSGFNALGIQASAIAIPDLVQHIESGAPVTTLHDTIRTALTPLAGMSYTHIVLGCTHFPLIRGVFEAVFNELGIDAILVDPAESVVDTVEQRFTLTGAGGTFVHTSKQSSIFTGYLHEYAACDEVVHTDTHVRRV